VRAHVSSYLLPAFNRYGTIDSARTRAGVNIAVPPPQPSVIERCCANLTQYERDAMRQFARTGVMPPCAPPSSASARAQWQPAPLVAPPPPLFDELQNGSRYLRQLSARMLVDAHLLRNIVPSDETMQSRTSRSSVCLMSFLV
jgi:hypothetical protein